MKSQFELYCRESVLSTIENNIPVRHYHDWFDFLEYSYQFDRCFRGIGRPDIVVKLKYPTYIEHIVIECKSCFRDLTSGCGLNFEGDSNYILFSKDELPIWQVKKHLTEVGAYHVGMLCIDENGKIEGITKSWSLRSDVPKWMRPFGFGTEFGDYYDTTKPV